MESFEEAWGIICSYCKTKITDVAYNTWISRIEPIELDFDKNKAVILVPNDFHRQTITRCYLSLLNEAFEAVFGQIFVIEMKIPEEISVKEEQQAAANAEITDISYEYTFDTFIVGSSNKFAHAACLAVATNPANAYNPLFLYGNSGLGKTHLLYAIGNEIKKNSPEKTICYIKGDDFTNELIESLRMARMSEFRKKYRQADILLVDDVQFIGGKESTCLLYTSRLPLSFIGKYTLARVKIIHSRNIFNRFYKLFSAISAFCRKINHIFYLAFNVLCVKLFVQIGFVDYCNAWHFACRLYQFFIVIVKTAVIVKYRKQKSALL